MYTATEAWNRAALSIVWRVCRNKELKIYGTNWGAIWKVQDVFVNVRGTGEVTQDWGVFVAEQHIVDFSE